MDILKRRIKQPVPYRAYAWAGRRVYSLIESLTKLNNWLDKKAGEYWIEDF